MKKLTLLLILMAVIGCAFMGFTYLRKRSAQRDAEEQRLAAQTAYETVCAFHQAHPDQIKEILEGYKTFITQFPASELAIQAKAQMEQIVTEQKRLRQDAKDQFTRTIDDLIATERLEDALAYARDYAGPFPSELKALRESYSQKIRQQLQTRADSEAQAAANAQLVLNQRIQSIAENLYRFQFAEADALLKQALADPALAPAKDELQAFADNAEPLCLLPQQICSSFLENMDTPVVVQLKTGEKNVRITDVDGTTVLADRVIYVEQREVGSAPEPFTFNDLSLREIAARIGKDRSDENLLAMSLVLIRAKQYDKAIRLLDAASSPLAPLFREMAEADAAASAAAGAAPVRKPVTDPVFEPDENNKLIQL